MDYPQVRFGVPALSPTQVDKFYDESEQLEGADALVTRRRLWLITSRRDDPGQKTRAWNNSFGQPEIIPSKSQMSASYVSVALGLQRG
jgi:hypothetical protein